MTDQKLSDIATHLTLADTTRFYGVNGTTSGYADMDDVTAYVDGNIDYESPLTFSTGLTRATNTVTVNTSQNIATLSNLTSNGLLKTTGGTGVLSIDTTAYTPTSTTVNGHALSSNVTISASDLSTGTLAAARGGAGTVSGIMKANGSGTVSAATAGTDYESPLTFSAGLTRSTNTVTVNTSQNIATLSNLTGNGFIKTSGGTGALSVDTTAYVATSVTVNGHALSSNVTVSASDLTTGTLAAANGGAGTVSGIMKANGSGTVSAATVNVNYAPAALSLNAQTGTTYTTVLGDATEVITMSNASANTLTIPANSSVAYPTGTQIAVYQIGAGQTTIAQGSGVTINTAAGTKKLRAQYSGATLLKTGTDTWLLVGDLAAS